MGRIVTQLYHRKNDVIILAMYLFTTVAWLPQIYECSTLSKPYQPFTSTTSFELA